jgi:hypothetical protein
MNYWYFRRCASPPAFAAGVFKTSSGVSAPVRVKPYICDIFSAVHQRPIVLHEQKFPLIPGS